MTRSSSDNHAIATLERIKTFYATPATSSSATASSESDIRRKLPAQHKFASLDERPFDLEAPANEALHELDGRPPPETIFYLAYGSNLCFDTFQRRRGIRPLSQANVLVPELVLTFDLPGLPFLEPCFANTKYRTFESPASPSPQQQQQQYSSLAQLSSKDYHKTRWQRGLVGVVYEVTTADYAKIIATEGGYNDILVTCYELPQNISTVSDLLPDTILTLPSLKAHTLYCPLLPRAHPDLSISSHSSGLVSRPDPNYAQPSVRYLNLITTGAVEHALPQDYIEYLRNIRPYILTSKRQKLGRLVFMGVWLPIIIPTFSLNRLLADKRGRAPWWLRMLLRQVSGLSWESYDWVFRHVFGDGERTMGLVDNNDDEKKKMT